ncbi:unnamed protein product, partial [Didymodactylos carnosus]
MKTYKGTDLSVPLNGGVFVR